ncbi:hypothetical protein GE061_012299 [Apolygus lucorum]|uniref:FP protein C-terminal domain-containing protein n=1 Tax=Apolygus lucorum TaxID=248454 RepID=A0A6A4JY40_APOLU|nr:hypothetical protein GE061_012299 [Apolygus lucorum]
MNKEVREKWLCDRCIKGDPLDGSGASDGKERAENEKEVSPTSPYSIETGTTERAIHEVNSKLTILLAVAGDVKDLKETVSFMSAQFDRFVEEISGLKVTVDSLTKDNTELKGAVGELQRKVEFLEQESRNSNVEVHGVPESPNESCVDIVEEVVKQLNVECGKIGKAFRVGPPRKDRPRKILAVLSSPDGREKLVQAAKADRQLTASELFKDWPKNRIYVNDNLTNFRADLFRRTKLKAKERGIQHVWMKNFVVHVRRSEGERAMTIKSFEDIEKI